MHKNFSKNLYVFLVFLFLFLPIIILIIYSFNTSKMNILFDGFTLKWYKELFYNRDLMDALKNSFIVAFTSTIISTIIGTISAIGLHQYDFKFKKFINTVLYIPIVIPEIVLGISLLSIYTLINIRVSMFTLILAHIAFSIPYVIVSVRSSLSNHNPHLEEAAIDLGANKLQTLWYVTIPDLLSGIKSGALLALTLSLDDVVISFFTAGPDSNTLPLKIYSMIKTGVTPDVNALSTLIIIVVLIILISSSLIQARNLKKVGYVE